MWKPTLVDPKVLFHGWLIYSYLQIFKLINCKWLPGECADWFFDNIMTWPHWRYSMYRQKNSVLIHEHALNSEPVPLKVDCLYALFVTWSMLLVMFENNKSAGLWFCGWSWFVSNYDTYNEARDQSFGLNLADNMNRKLQDAMKFHLLVPFCKKLKT